MYLYLQLGLLHHVSMLVQEWRLRCEITCRITHWSVAVGLGEMSVLPSILLSQRSNAVVVTSVIRHSRQFVPVYLPMYMPTARHRLPEHDMGGRCATNKQKCSQFGTPVHSFDTGRDTQGVQRQKVLSLRISNQSGFDFQARGQVSHGVGLHAFGGRRMELRPRQGAPGRALAHGTCMCHRKGAVSPLAQHARTP